MIALFARLLPVLAALAAVAHADVASTDPLAGLEQEIEAARVQWRAPGLAVAIVKDDRPVFVKGFGVRRLGKNEPVDEHTLFTLASTTKAFTATAMGLLVDEGKLAWDDAVLKHYPEFRVADPYVTREATLRDLLAHRTGVEEMDILWSRGFDTATSLARMPHARQAASLRSTWIYNNILYVLAADIVARKSGMTFDRFVAERIFAPLGMKDSTFTGPELAQRDNVAGAHMLERAGPRAIDPWWTPHPLGAAGVQSSADDMAQWLRMLLNKGEFQGKVIVKPETLAEMLKPHMLVQRIGYPVTAQLATPQYFAYGLGWFAFDYKGRKVAMHTGSLYGANALAVIVPEERLGLVVLVNAGPVDYRHALMYDVFDRYFGGRERNWNREVSELSARLSADADKERAKAMQARPERSRPSGPLSGYAGAYTNQLAGDAHVATRNDRLTISMPPAAVFTLTHWSYDTFEASDDRAPEHERFLLTFKRGPDGKVIGYDIVGGRSYAREN